MSTRRFPHTYPINSASFDTGNKDHQCTLSNRLFTAAVTFLFCPWHHSTATEGPKVVDRSECPMSTRMSTRRFPHTYPINSASFDTGNKDHQCLVSSFKTSWINWINVEKTSRGHSRGHWAFRTTVGRCPGHHGKNRKETAAVKGHSRGHWTFRTTVVAVQRRHGKNRKETAAVNILFDRVHWCFLFPVLKATELIG